MRHILFLWLLLIGGAAIAQNQVQVTVTALPPFDPFLQDYFNQPGKLQVILRNTTNAQLTIKLQANLTGDNGVEIMTSPGYQPLQPLTLGPLQTRLLNVADLKNLIDLSQVTVSGFDKAALLRGQALPEGNYQLCLQAIDMQSNRPLSPAELGCTRIPVKSVEPPILIAPLCDQDVTPQVVQNIVFTWSPPAGVLPSNVEYTLRIVELPLQNTDPNVYIDAVVLPASGLEMKGLRTNSFLYSPAQPALVKGKKYAWRVQARDPQGKLVFLNDGKSPVCSFQYGEPVVVAPPKPLVVAAPKAPNGLNGKLIQAICPNGTLVTNSTLAGANANTTIITTTQSRTVIEVQANGSGKVVTKPAGSTMLVANNDATDATTTSQNLNTGYVLTVGNGTDLVLSWMADPKLLLALSQYSGKKDSASVRSIVQNIPGARYEVSVFGAAGSGQLASTPASLPLWVGSSPNEFYSFDPDKADFPLQFGQQYWYRVRLVLPQIAQLMLQKSANLTDLSGLTSDMCTFMLKQKPAQTVDYVVTGQLRYQFDGFPGNFPAANTDISLSFVNETGQTLNPKLSKTDKSTPDPRAQTYLGKTDETGVFRVVIPRKDQIGQILANAKSKTLLTYRVGLTNKHYQSPDKLFTLKTTDPDSSNLGQIVVNAYAYQLKVTVKKRFDKFFVQAFTGIDSNTATAKVGSQTVETGGLEKTDKSLTQALVGMKIHVYRKSKPLGLPPMEGQIGLTALDPLANGAIPVAQGISALETDAAGNPQAYVIFDRLLPTISPGEEYYIQAAPDPARNIAAGTPSLFGQPLNLGQTTVNVNGVKTTVNTGGKPDPLSYLTAQETFVAPEDTISLPYSFFFAGQKLGTGATEKTYLSTTKDYGLMTSRPPSSKIKGRLTYTWPGRSEKFILANAPFVIRIGYAGAGFAQIENLGMNLAYPDQCGATTTGTNKTIIGTPTTTTGDGQKIALTTEDDGQIVASGKTDANGYFSIDAVNLNQKGAIVVNAQIQTETVHAYGIPCDNGKKATPDPNLQTPGQKYADPVINPGNEYSNGGTYQQINIGALVQNPNGAGQLNNNAPGWGNGNQQSNLPATTPTVLPGQKPGPGPAEPDMVVSGTENVGSVSRVFFLDVQSPFYDDPGKAVVVDAFAETDAGEFVATVRQWTGKPTVFFDKNKAKPVAGARVVAYRPKGWAANDKRFVNSPELEGDGLDKSQPLPVNSRNAAALPPGGPATPTDAVDYFAEGFTNADGTVEWTTQKPLLLNPVYYKFYALPNSAQDIVATPGKSGTTVQGGYFEPKIQDGNPNFTVDITTSRLIVRLLDATKQSGLVDQKDFSQGLAGTVKLSVNGKKYVYSVADDGYREIDLAGFWVSQSVAKDKPITFSVEGIVPGYTAPVSESLTVNLQGDQVVKNLVFTTGATITGRVVNSQGDGLQSFLIRADSSVIDTQTDGRFVGKPVPLINPQALVIRPRDPAYWDDTLTLPTLKAGNNTLNDRVLKRREHRMRFVVTDKTTGKPIIGAIVFVADVGVQGKGLTNFTGQNGEALFSFENVSINNYRVQVLGKSGTATTGLVDQAFTVVNAESKDFITYNVKAETGATVIGKVTLDGKPVAGARVYLDYKMTADPSLTQQLIDELAGKPDADSTDAGMIETYTLQDGSYTLPGLPIDNATISIRATLGKPGELYNGKNIIGDKQSVTIQNKKGVRNLALTSYQGMALASAFGFPLTVEALKINPDKTITVTALLDLRKSQTGFAWRESGEVVRIRDVKFKATDNGRATPVVNMLVLEGLTGLKFRYAGRYNVEIQNEPTVTLPALPLRILPDADGRGQLTGPMQIVDNSFNYPSTYMNFESGSQFFLTNLPPAGPAGARVINDGNTPPANALPKPDFNSQKADTKLLVLSALSNDQAFNAFTAQPVIKPVTYGLCGTNGKALDFSLLQFPTTADPNRSYIDPADGKIHLNVWLDCAIPNAQPAKFAVNIDDLVLDNQSLYPKDGSKPLRLGFEAWTLEVKNWSFDPKQGGIYALNVPETLNKIVMKTNAVDIPFHEFLLRPDIFRLNGPNLSSLDIGGIASLKVTDPSTAIFTYDVAFSGEGHWKLSIPGKDKQPAATLNIGPAQGNNKVLGQAAIKFDYVQVLSNNQTVMNLTEGQNFGLMGNPLAGFVPTQFSSGSGFLDMKGMFRVIDAPRVPSAAMTINLRKTQAPALSSLPDDFGFEIKGHAAFHIGGKGSNNLYIDKNLIVIPGTVEEPDATPKLKAEFRASTAYKSYPYFIQVLNQSGVSVGGNMMVDVIATNSAQADKTDWQKPLVFVGQLYQTGGANAQLKQGPDGNVMQFSVYGDMHVNQMDQKGLQADSVFSKGGNLSLKPDGSFQLDKVPVFGQGKDANGMLALNNRGVTIDALRTPFGEVKLFFDFKARRLVGSIRISKIKAYDPAVQGDDPAAKEAAENDPDPATPENPKPIEMGPFKVMGQGSLLIDPDGMYVVASVLAQGDVIPPPIQGITLGVAVGYRNYEPDAITILRGASNDPLLVCKIGDAVHGLFIGAGATLFHKEKDVPFVVGKAWFKADATLTASAKIDIGGPNGPGITFSAGANADAEAGISVICASASVGFGVFGDLTGKIKYPLAFCANATIGLRAQLSISSCGLFGKYTLTKYYALIGQVKKPNGQSCSFDFDIDSYDGPIDAGQCDNLCPCASF